MPSDYLAAITRRGGSGSAAPDEVRHVESEPGRVGVAADWPVWVPAPIRERLSANGISQPWRHQVEGAEAVWRGESVVISTGTASGKSLSYQLPALAMLASDPRARVLYLAPTKALAADQLRAVRALGVEGLRAATFDGDTPLAERNWVRDHASIVLSNPDMISRTVLPQHEQWSSFLRRLRLVVIDECHHYRGVFGSHVGMVLRRLRRLCAAYGCEPTFVLASATSADPGAAAQRLIGSPVLSIAMDDSPRAARRTVLWEPPLTELRGENGAPLRRSAGSDAARILADLVVAGAATLVFARSRRGAEIIALAAQRHLIEAGAGDLAGRVAAYRGGYLAEDRRELEARLSQGHLRGVVATNALELGVDISGLDAVVLVGYPGTLASFWQQAGRSGRGRKDALVVFVAQDDPLDSYLVHHPAAVFDRPVEATVTDPANPYVLGPQLCCAASERPIRPAEVGTLGGPAAEAVLAELVTRGLLRRRPNGWYWARRDRPTVDLRGGADGPVAVVELATGRLLGTVDRPAAPASVHSGAVYLHQGETFVVDELDLETGTATVRPARPDWTTVARTVSDLAVQTVREETRYGPVSVGFGDVRVSAQVRSYQRRRFTGEVIDEIPLDLPEAHILTTAVWYCLDEEACDEVGLGPAELPGALHAAEHAAIGLLPLFAHCDRWDIGGLSTALHPQTGRPTVFVHDGQPGGAGFSARGRAVLPQWLAATAAAIAACECAEGCPSCTQSPKCGNGNAPLDKAGALMVLHLVLAAIDPHATVPSRDVARSMAARR